MKTITYLFPVYNEEGNVTKLIDAVRAVQKSAPQYKYENLFVNDGSSDKSLQILLKRQKKDKTIRIIDFSRNFGHQIALTAGFDYAEGDAVIVMDSDMQDPPSVSLELIKKWEEGYEVVFAQRRTRKDTFFKKTTADIFYRVLHKMAEIEIPRNTGDFRLIDRKVVNALKTFRERNRFIRGLTSYIGFQQIAVPFDREERFSGETKYPLKKMIRFAADGILGFSTYPLTFIRNIGVLVSMLAFIGIIYALTMWLFVPQLTVPGWTFIVISVLFCSGIQIIMLSILGSYVGRIYSETQNRPLYIVREFHT